jgi:hypothetical protein
MIRHKSGLGGQTIGRSGGAVCDPHHTRGGDEKRGFLLAFLSHRIINKRTDANCSIHLRVFQGIESTGKQ